MHKVGGIDRKAIDIAVADKVFKISFVSIYARKCAADFQKTVAEFIDIQLIEDDKQREEEMDKLNNDEINAKIALREEIIQHVLESNGYTYDKDWWEKHTTSHDQNEFVQFCLMKDIVEDKKKQAKQ